MKNELKKLLIELLKNKIILINEDGAQEHNPLSKSPILPLYFNIREIRSHVDLHNKLVKEYEKIIQSINFDLIADVPLGSSTIAWDLAKKFKKPMVTPRINPKNYGKDKNIIGKYKSNQKVLVIDDVIVNGTKKQVAINALEQSGLKIAGIIAFLDWQRGGKEKLESKGYITKTVTNVSYVLNFFEQKNIVNNNFVKQITSKLTFLI